MKQLEDYFNLDERLSIIDADSIIYVIAWRNREGGSLKKVQREVNEFMQDIVTRTRATHYLGVFSASKTFRNELAVSRPYKGTRGPAPEWVTTWKSAIIDYCIQEYGFFVAENIEADDVLSIMRRPNAVYCSPDKDLEQIPGLHYDYSKDEWSESTEEEAAYIYWKQVLTGDTTDNIPGLPGMGKVGAAKLLSGATYNKYEEIVENAYYKKLGPAYKTYYEEQKRLITLLGPDWELVEKYTAFIQAVEFTGESPLLAADLELNIQSDGLKQTGEGFQLGDILSVTSDLS